MNDLSPTSSVLPQVLENSSPMFCLGVKHHPAGPVALWIQWTRICRALTNGKWKLPKHAVLGMALWHMFHSAELVIILNRLGHCENYSFLLEKALAVAIDNISSLLQSNTIRNPSCQFIFHLLWQFRWVCLSLTKSLHCLNPVILTFANFVASILT